MRRGASYLGLNKTKYIKQGGGGGGTKRKVRTPADGNKQDIPGVGTTSGKKSL